MSAVRLVYGVDDKVAEFVNALAGGESDDCYAAIGISVDGEIKGGAVYWGYQEGRDISMSLASTTPRACTRHVIATLFAYPFVQLGLGRVSAQISRSNRRCRKLVEGVGFHVEGLKARAGDEGEDLILYGLFPENLKHAGNQS